MSDNEEKNDVKNVTNSNEVKIAEKKNSKIKEEVSQNVDPISSQEKKPPYVIKLSKKTLLISTICVIIALILLICCTGFAVFNINNTKMISGITINGIEVQGLNKEEAKQKITEITTNELKKEITIKLGDYEHVLSPLDNVSASYNVDEIIEKAYSIGRNSNLFSNNFEIMKSTFRGNNFALNLAVDKEALDKVVNDIASKVPNKVKEPSHYIEKNKLIIVNGIAGVTINSEELKSLILNKIVTNDEAKIEVATIAVEPQTIDIDKIYSEVYTKAQDARIVDEPFEIFPHVEGIDFDKEEAKKIIAKEVKKEYEIDLTKTLPKITTDKLGTKAFPAVLASFTTKYDASNTNRSTNLRLSAEKLNEVVVMPGEICSYNQTVGERTIAAGYKEANGFAGGGVVPTLAGGICQISSTLYNAVLLANLEIVDRSNHMFQATYLDPSRDATVVYGAIDFKFKNTRKHPIMLRTSVRSGVAKIEVLGIKEDVEYEIVISSKVLSSTPYSVVYKDDSSLAAGKERVEQYGTNGCKSQAYKIIKFNGVEIDRDLLSTDYYDPLNKIVIRGTKKAAPKKDTTKEKETNEKNTEGKDTQTNDKASNTTDKPTNTTTGNDEKTNT